MQLDFSIGERIIAVLEANNIAYDQAMSDGFFHILVRNEDALAIFIVYGFFEEYVYYERDPETDQWALTYRNELNFTSIADILKGIGIETSDE